MAFIALVYISFANRQLSEDELKEILNKSRENNTKLGVTGMLLYRNGFFIQALEGEEATVMSLYEKIKKDERHRSTLMVHVGRISQRSYEDWSMGFQYIDNQDLAKLEGFSDFLDKPFTGEFFKKNPSSAQILLFNFKERKNNRL
jgi:hypothetical protein